MQTEPLPNAPSGWNEYSLITNLSPITQEKEFYFTPDIIPTTKFSVVNEYSNSSITLDEYDFGFMSFALATPGIAAMAMIGMAMPVAMIAELSRKECWIVCGSNDPVKMVQSPRFGFSIGNLFKHQAYIKLHIVGAGITGAGGRITWLTAPAVSSIEYSTNSRFRKFIVNHGKILGTRIGTGETKNKMYIKLFDNVNSTIVKTDSKTGKALSNGIPSGTMSIYGSRSGGFKNGNINFSGITQDWEAIVDYDNSSDAFIPSSGDFYVLSKPIMCENPQTLFEFNTRVEDGVFITNEQKFKVETNIIGIWNYDETKGLQVAYIDEEFEDLIHLPSGSDSIQDGGTYIPSVKESLAGEYHESGGSLKSGISIFKSGTGLKSTIRLITKSQGGAALHNFFAGNLIGEFIQVGDKYYEIIDQPRLDTIEVSNYSVTDGTALISSDTEEEPASDSGEEEGTETEADAAGGTEEETEADADEGEASSGGIGEVTIYQQNFWKIAELYGLTGIFDGAFNALWSGTITSLKMTGTNSYEVKWKTSESYTHLFLPSYETERTKIKTLPERFRTLATDPGVVSGYDQYSGWRLVINNIDFKVVDFKVVEDVPSNGGSEAEISITATVQGNPSTYADVGSGVYVTLDEPFETALGTPKRSNSSISIWTDITRTNSTPSSPALYMYGYYDAGKYSLPTTIDSSHRFSISSFAYGIDSKESYLGAPATWLSTSSGAATGISYLQHGNNSQQTLLYKDPDIEILTAVTADPGWIERRTKSAIHCGLAIQMAATTQNDKKETVDSVPSDDSYMLISMQGTMSKSASNGTNVLKGYFAVVPASTDTPYHSVTISGYGGIETPLTRKNSMTITSTDAHPVQLPLEIYEPMSNETGNVSIKTSVMAKTSSVTLSKCGFKEIKGKTLFDLIKSGSQLPWEAPDIKASSFSFAKARQLLQNVKQFNAHMLENGSVLLFYTKESAKFYFEGADIEKESNPSQLSVFTILSSTNLDSWGSPKFDRKNLELTSGSLGANESEWERPMMIAYDFDFITSIKLWSADQFLVFGYGYGKDSEGISQNGNNSYLFLGCYFVSTAGMQTGTTKKCKLTIAGNGADDNIANQFYYRPNHVTSDEEKYNMNFGVALKGTGNIETTKNDPTDFCTEAFTRIIGGVHSKAHIGGNATGDDIWSLSKDTIGVDTAVHGMIYVYFRDPSSDEILRMWSCTRGELWDIEVQDPDTESSPPIRYAIGSSPTVFKNLLFYFFGDTLYCKDLSIVSEGDYAQGAFGAKQEQLDSIVATVVASDVVGHKIAPNIDPHGRVVVFYLDKTGNIRASLSSDSGQTWANLNNW